MKKRVLALVLAACMVIPTVACDNSNAGNTQTTPNGSGAGTVNVDVAPDQDVVATAVANGEIVDGKFVETRHITVEVYDRGNDGGSDPTNNMYTDYIKQGMLDTYNVEVEFVAVPRWTEVEEINNLLAAGDAPDICLTYDYATIKQYAKMGGVLDLSDLVIDNASLTPNLWSWLGVTNMYWDKDPIDGTLWAIEGKRAVTNRINTFIRKDWLDKLGLDAPTTTDEFEACLVAFRDNADTLLGADADMMIPYSVSFDVGWRAATLIESYIDPEISDYDFYVYGFDDRKCTLPGTKEAVRKLNAWYNDGLMWDDFAMYSNGETVEDDYMKAGYVGAFTHNWDYPFRNGEDSINCSLQRTVGEDAVFIAIDPFQDKNGGHNKFVTSSAGDRKIFFPDSNDEPLASLLYLEWISDPEHIQYLQLGEEGVTHDVLEDGSFALKAATGDAIMNSGNNIDYTITCNGLNLADPEITVLSIAHGYAGIDADLVRDANTIANTDARHEKNVNVGTIEAEDGMGTALGDKRNILYDQAVACPVDQFDAVWDQYMADYLSSGGQDIIDERIEKWNATFGDTDMLPED